MSDKKDILDGKYANKSRSGLVYTCKCGWLDLGHARPDGAEVLWKQILNESGTKSKDKKGFKVSYSQSMKKSVFSRSFSEDYYVRSGLSRSQKESVALSIFMEVSVGFEALQNSFPYSSLTNSGFSAEDLVSDLIGFYRAVRPEVNYVDECKPVSKSESERIWDTYGAVGKNKNHSFQPFIYTSNECRKNTFPSSLNSIAPAKKGELFRKWSKFSD